MKIVTNNQSRDILSWWELTPKEQKEFDYLDEGDGSFFRYKGLVFDLGEFMRIDKSTAPPGRWRPLREGWEKWDGYASDSYFSGVLVRYSSDYDSVIVGSYFA